MSEGVDKNSEINPSQEPKSIRSMKGGLILVFVFRIEKERRSCVSLALRRGNRQKFISLIRQGTSTQWSSKACILCFGRNALLKQGILEVFQSFLHRNQEHTSFPHEPSKYRNHRLKKAERARKARFHSNNEVKVITAQFFFVIHQ